MSLSELKNARPVKKICFYDKNTSGNMTPDMMRAKESIERGGDARVVGIYIDNAESDTPEKRTAFNQMMKLCDEERVDCIVVPSEETLFGNVELMCDSIKSIADRSVLVYAFCEDKLLNYEEIWDGLVMLADEIIFREEN